MKTTCNFLKEEELSSQEAISEIDEILPQKFVLHGCDKVAV
jgi:hypothetical protein